MRALSCLRGKMQTHAVVRAVGSGVVVVLAVTRVKTSQKVYQTLCIASKMPPYSECEPLLGSWAPLCTARVFVQGLCIVARAAAPLCVGFPRCGRGAHSRRWCGRGCRRFLFGSGVLRGVVPPFFRVRRWCGRRALYFRLLAGVVAQPCAFRWLALGPGLCCAWRGKRKKSVSFT